MSGWKHVHAFFSLAAAASAPAAGKEQRARSPEVEAVQKALDETSKGISAAYARGDIAGVMAFHHPDVTKALGFGKVLVGRKAVADDGAQGLARNHTQFVRHDVESLLVFGDTAVQQTVFAIRRTPRAGGPSSLFTARALTVYVRDSRSPTNWALIRAVIQPAER